MTGITTTRALALTDDRKFQAALARFQDHTELLRTLTSVDIQIFGGYLAIQLALATWVGENALKTNDVRLGVMLVDITIAALSAKLLYNNYRRRIEVVGGLKRVIEVLCFREKGVYLSEQTLDADTVFRPWWPWYLIGVGVALLGVLLVVFRASA